MARAPYIVNFGEFAGFAISLEQRGVDNFAVRYGKQLDIHLTYAAAAAKLGQAFMHAAACEGKIDNRTKQEAIAEARENVTRLAEYDKARRYD